MSEWHRPVIWRVVWGGTEVEVKVLRVCSNAEPQTLSALALIITTRFTQDEKEKKHWKKQVPLNGLTTQKVTAIETEGYKTLNEGQTVEFTLIQGPKGLAAANVIAV